jgi:signal transduction histidine kinase
MMLELLPPDADRFQREALEVMSHASGRMQRLIEDLLDVSRIEHGTFSLQLAQYRLEELFAEAERLLRPAAEAREIDLRFAASERVPPLRVDGARVIQVLSNLVGNAIKFTPEGGRVTVACATAGEDVELTVADTGPGISAAQLPHLFGAFWQARGDDRRGVGLGLWIARSIVEAHGGRIRVDSREGQGTLFGFTLPLAPAASEAHAAGPHSVAVPGLIADRSPTRCT